MKSWLAARWQSRWLAVGVLALAAASISAVLIPRIHVSGSYADGVVLPLGSQERPRGATTEGVIDVNVDGFTVDRGDSGTITVPVRLPPAAGTPIVRLWANSPPQGISEVLVEGPRGAKALGRAVQWTGRPFKIADVARGGDVVRVTVRADNPSGSAALVLDQIAVGTAPPDSEPNVAVWLFALWAAIIVAAGVAAAGQLRRHWPLIPVVAGAAGLLWDAAMGAALLPLDGSSQQLWDAARNADLFSLHTGLLSGSFGELSHLGTELFALLIPLTGDGVAGARTASTLVALVTLVVLYVTGNRVAERHGAILAPLVVLAADGFRIGAEGGSAVPVLVLAGTLMVLAIHPCLAETSRYSAGLFGLAGAVAVLAEPLWLPGLVAVLAILVALYGTDRQKWRVFATGLLVLVILLLPSRISTADQNGGDLFADLGRRAVFARNVEFSGRGHGAVLPDRLPAAPYGGRPVGLTSYLFGEHSFSVVVGGSLSGAQDALDAFAERKESRLAGLIAFVLALAGSVYLLILPRLRQLLLLPLLIAAPALFFVSRGAMASFAGGAAIWPAFAIAAGVLAYAAAHLVAGRVRIPRPKHRRTRSAPVADLPEDESTVRRDMPEEVGSPSRG